MFSCSICRECVCNTLITVSLAINETGVFKRFLWLNEVVVLSHQYQSSPKELPLSWIGVLPRVVGYHEKTVHIRGTLNTWVVFVQNIKPNRSLTVSWLWLSEIPDDLRTWTYVQHQKWFADSGQIATLLYLCCYHANFGIIVCPLFSIVSIQHNNLGNFVKMC